jgi:hypothetical protein
MKVDLRKLNLRIVVDGYVRSIENFIEYHHLEKEFKKEYNIDINDWEYDIGDCDVIETLCEKYLNTEDRVYFCEYLEKEDVIEVYYITRWNV